MKDHSPKAIVSMILWCLLSIFQFTPALVSEARSESVTIGLNVPLSGAYKDQGFDEKRAYELAIEKINSQGGVLGKTIEYVLKDTKTNATVAKQNALDLISQNQVVMITGGSSSSTALAVSDVCEKKGIIFMAALAHSNSVTGYATTPGGWTEQKAHRHTFRWYFNAWMTSKALGPYMVKNFGNEAEYFYITADYTWGESVEQSIRLYTESRGAVTLGTIKTALGKNYFVKELEEAKKADPDVLVLVEFGRDMIISLKQAADMGLKRKMKIVVPLMEENMAYGAGPNVMENVISTMNWYWGLKDKYPGSKEFVDAFMNKYKKAPGSAAASAWTAIHEWVSAVERAGSFDDQKVIKALEGHKFTLLKDQEYWREWDHQCVSSVYVVRGKSKSEMKNSWDLLEIVSELKGESVVRSVEENPVMLEPFKKTK